MKIEKIKLTEIDAHIDGHIHFVACSSYENRCLSVVQSLSTEKIEKALIAFNKDIRPHIQGNHQQLEAILEDKMTSISMDTTDPIETADNLRMELEKVVKADSNILVDITTFTHESLLILLKLLTLITDQSYNVKFIYTSAGTYGGVNIGDGNDNKERLEGIAEEMWLSKGVVEVRNVLGYSGEVFSSRKTHLIVLVGFEHERALELVNEYEPAYLSLGLGKASGSISPKHHEANRKFHSLLNDITSHVQEVNSFEFSCNDPVDTQKAVIDQAGKFSETNVIVAPMNTKISTLGVCLVNQQDETIQICYAKAMKYNYENYSTPGDSCYLIELPELFA